MIVGRQNTAWKMFDYIPTDWTDPSGATGLPTREASRTLEVMWTVDLVWHISVLTSSVLLTVRTGRLRRQASWHRPGQVS